jgi:hypothetical protein
LRAKYAKELKIQNDEYLKTQEDKQKLFNEISQLKESNKIIIFCENSNANEFNNL